MILKLKWSKRAEIHRMWNRDLELRVSFLVCIRVHVYLSGKGDTWITSDFKAWVRQFCCHFGVKRKRLGMGSVVKFMLWVQNPLFALSSPNALWNLRILRYLPSTWFMSVDVKLNHPVYAVSLKESFCFY